MGNSVRQEVVVWILVAVWIAAGAKVASPIGPGDLGGHRQPAGVFTLSSPHVPFSSRAIADDAPTQIPSALQTLAMLPSSAFLQITMLSATPGTEKDLLNLTQRRRE